MLVTRVRPRPRFKPRRVTVLFADLRGYTGMAERLPAAQVWCRCWMNSVASSAVPPTHSAARSITWRAMGSWPDSASMRRAAAVRSRRLAAGHAMLKGFAPLAERWRSELSIDAGIGSRLALGRGGLRRAGSAAAQVHHLGRRYGECRRADCAAVRAPVRSCFLARVAAALGDTAEANSAVGSHPFSAAAADSNCAAVAGPSISGVCRRRSAWRCQFDWCPEPGSNRHDLSVNGFSYLLRLSPPRLRAFGVWSAPRP